MKNNLYKISKNEFIINFLTICLIVAFVGKIFYGSWLISLVILPTAVPIYKMQRRNLENKKKYILELQFKDMLVSLADSMTAGYSINNAIKESYKEIVIMYGKESTIAEQLSIMISQLKLNISIEKVIQNFADTTQLENAKMFSEVFIAGKRTGGNLTEIVKDTANNISMKSEVKEEIRVTTREKILEQKIMTLIPIFIIIYIGFASPGFLDVMYKTIIGKVVMTICLGVYILAYIWSNKITQVEM